MAIVHEPSGESLLEKVPDRMGVTQYRLAQTISLPARRGASARSPTPSAHWLEAGQ